MNSIIINLILISIITVIIVDISNYQEHLEEALKKWLGKRNIYLPYIMKCSFCCNWWISLIYLIIGGHLSLITITVALLLSTLTPEINEVIYTIKDIINKILNVIQKIIN